MKLLVTGGSGFIGSHFIRRVLASDGYEVVNLDKLTYAGNQNNLADVKDKNYSFVRGDISRRKTVEDAIETHGIEAIVNFAAESHVDRSIKSPSAFIKTNIIGVYTLLEASRKHDLRLHHISTDEVFGELTPNQKPFDEKSPYNPRSPYSASKASADHLLMAYFNTYGVKATLSNCTNNFGPYQHPEKAIPMFVTSILEGKKIGVYGDGSNIREWLYVEDHVEAVQKILEDGLPGESYCVGGGVEKTNLEVAKLICAETGHGGDMIEFIQDRPGHDFRYAVDHSNLTRKLGWRPNTSFAGGLRKTVKWYSENQWWWKPLKRVRPFINGLK